MAAFGLAVGWEPRVFLGTVSVFFMLRGIITLVLQWWHGFFTVSYTHLASREKRGASPQEAPAKSM